MRLFWILFVFAPVKSYSDNITTLGEIYSSPCSDMNHLLLAPGVLTSGGVNRVCVSRFHTEGLARLILTLITERRQTVTAYRELPPGDGGCLDISIPQNPNSKADLIVSIGYPEARCTWERRITLRVLGGRVVVVHTERPRYRAADTLRFRVIVLKADLTPSHGTIEEIWLEGPGSSFEGARLMQWQRVRTRLGVAQLAHQLDDNPAVGTWAVRVRLADGSQGSANFWVGNYELPPFQLTVRHAPKVLKTSERLVWTVCVRYPWTEAVEGMLVIRLRGAGGGGGGEGVHTAARLRAPRACHTHAAAARRVGLTRQHPPHVIIADFSFQEEGTRVWQNTTVVSQVVDKHLSLEFLMKHRTSIASDLPQKLKVKATRWDDKAGFNERLRVCRSLSTEALRPELRSSVEPEPDMCAEAVTDSKGVAKFLFPADDLHSPFYIYKATLANDSSISSTVSVPSRGESRAVLGGTRDPRGDVTLIPLYLNMNTTRAITVHFVVISRGGIIHRWGATTQCPIASTENKIQAAGRNSLCHSSNLDYTFYKLDVATLNSNSNSSDALLDRHLKKIMLPVKVTPQMCPNSHVIAYFYHNGELISASKHFEFDECFVNKVELTWSSRQTAPGTLTSIQLSTPGPALCGLTAIDIAAKWNNPGISVKDMLMKSLKRIIDGHRNLTEFDAAGECFLKEDTRTIPKTGKELTEMWLAAAGIRVIGGASIRRTCMEAVPEPMQEEEIIPRSDFSEAWLWRLVPVGANGSVTWSARAPDSISRFEASAVCVAKNGVSISQPSVLQVFREFFIHADGPSRLRHGDETIIRYRIFNYLYENLSVQVQLIADGDLVLSSPGVEAMCVRARSSAARRVAGVARGGGAARGRGAAGGRGQATLLVRATAVADDKCGNSSSRGVSDEIQMKILIEPEGRQIREEKSILLCAEGSPESSASRVSWEWGPVGTGEGGESLTVWASGDVVGPLLADADALVSFPRGCGEQNLARMATSLLARRLLHAHAAARAAATEHVARGFSRQLQFAHPSGGFSAFGTSDPMPSTWLTAFAVRYMRRAYQELHPGLPVPAAVEKAESWLVAQQMENGCFRSDGQVFHRELKGGLSEDGETAHVAMTAYVITSLLDSSIPLSSKLVSNTLACLRALPPSKTKTSTRIYAQVLLGYAFMRLRKYEDDLRKTNEASLLSVESLREDEEVRELDDMLRLAKRSEDLVWWETGSLSTTIEATSYALLALSLCVSRGAAGAGAPGEGAAGAGCEAAGRGASRWLARHRNAAGGFLSTQDTLVAIEALLAWKSAQPSTPANLTVTVQGDKKVTSKKLYPGVFVPEVMNMGRERQVEISVKGSGCALVQATRFHYTTASSDGVSDRRLAVHVAVKTDGPFDCEANETFCFCAAVVEACVTWVGEFPEMALMELVLPGGYGADASLLYEQLHQPNSLIRRIELSASNSRVTFYLRAAEGAGGAARGEAGGAAHACARVWAVGPRALTQPAHVSVMDYYNPDRNHTQIYTIPEDCPPRVAGKNKNYLRSDNLFTHAKSPHTGELLLSDEFSFEDIPEGIPLEDPLYDNMTDDKDDNRKDKEKKSKELPLEVDFLGDIDKTKQTPNSNLDALNEAKDNENSEQKTKKVEDYRIESVKESLEVEDEVRKLADNEIPKTEIKSKHRLEVRDDKLERNEPVENPNLHDFHVINTDKDLEVPPGVEGPIPAVVLPPQGFIAPYINNDREVASFETKIQNGLFPYYQQFRENYERYRLRNNF